MQSVSIVMYQVISLATTKLTLTISFTLLVQNIKVFLNKKIFRNSKVQVCSSLENPSQFFSTLQYELLLMRKKANLNKNIISGVF